MAVCRITAPAKWHLAAAALVPEEVRLARELRRAAQRPGLTAEFPGDEIRILKARLPYDERITKALGELEASEERERTRPRARDIALGLVKKKS